MDGYYTRIFYVKRINSNAVLLAAIYSADLSAKMRTSDQISDMTIRILDGDNNVIYSTADEEGGTGIDSKIANKITHSDRTSFIMDGQLVASNSCGDEWKVVSTVPTSSILKEVYEIRNFTFVIAGVGVVVVIIVGILFSQSITSPIRKLVSIMQQAEGGDLTVSADFKVYGEMALLAQSFNDMMIHIRELLGNVERVAADLQQQVNTINDIAQQSHTISENISMAMEEVAEGAATQLNESQKTFDSLENLAQNIGLTIDNMEDVNKSSHSAREIGSSSISKISDLRSKTEAVNASMNSMNETFDILVKEVKNIEEVISLILSINEETALLALNASIEAARAGEAGKGFSVVASQVSKLATQTEQSTDSVSVVIDRIRANVKDTVEILENAKAVFAEQSVIVGDTADSFQQILDSTDDITNKIGYIGQLTEEMTKLKEQSLNATKNILEITESSSANTQEVLSVSLNELEISKELSEKAAQLEQAASSLQESISQFKIS